MNKKILTYSSVVLGLIFIVVAIIYWTKTAGTLPTYFPGFEAGVDKIHFKHGLGSLILGIGLFIYAWFKSGAEKKAPPQA